MGKQDYWLLANTANLAMLVLASYTYFKLPQKTLTNPDVQESALDGMPCDNVHCTAAGTLLWRQQEVCVLFAWPLCVVRVNVQT